MILNNITAVDYFQFVLNCQHALLSLNSHKLAWAASLLYSLAGPEPQYLNAIETITDHFIKQQDNQGLWYTVDHYKAPFLRNIEKFYTRQGR